MSVAGVASVANASRAAGVPGMAAIRPGDVKFATDDVKVLLAGAGAGKTSALMDELAELLRTKRPDEIAFVTFTRKGVANGIDRALRANPWLKAEDLPHFKTLHALCYRELGLERSAIITWRDLKEFNSALGFKLHLNDAFGYRSEDDELLSRYDAFRSGAKTGLYAYITAPYDETRYRRLTRAYEAFKKARSLVDFHDCLLRFRDRGKPVAVKAALIDEAQDLTLLQWEVCVLAFSQCDTIRVAGDDCQSVFAYAGASPATLVSLASRHQTVKLEKSYRLPEEVYRFSRGLTKLIGNKIDKDFRPAKDVQGFVKEIPDRMTMSRIIQRDFEKNGAQPGRWYLLFRNNCFISTVTSVLEPLVIPYHTARGFCLSERNLAKIKRYYNFRKLGFSTKEVFEKFRRENKIEDINDDFVDTGLIPSDRRYVYWDYVNRIGADELIEMSKAEPWLLLSTPHKVKGGEAENVVVFLDCTKKVSDNVAVDIDEELRTMYVACTRAKTGLYICDASGVATHNLGIIVDLVKEAMQ